MNASSRPVSVFPLVLLCLLAIAGVLDGVYLTLVHVDYLTGYEGISGACHRLTSAGCSVTAGRFGAIGPVPVATIGLAGSLSMAVLAAAAIRRRRLPEDPFRTMLLAMATIAVLASVVMATASFVEGSFCPFCVTWYAINLALWGCALWARNRGLAPGALVDHVLGGAGFVAALVFGAGLAAGVWVHDRRLDEVVAAQERTMMRQAPAIAARLAAEMTQRPPVELDTSSLPTSGPSDADVYIVEFGDFECPYCRKLWDVVKGYAELSGKRVRVSFAHFPLNSACNADAPDLHPDACGASRAAICADAQGAFWTFAEALFADQHDLAPDDLRDHAAALGLDLAAFDACLADPATERRLQQDVQMGHELEIAGTPTFVVNGYVTTGALPGPIFSALVDELLRLEAP